MSVAKKSLEYKETTRTRNNELKLKWENEMLTCENGLGFSLQLLISDRNLTNIESPKMKKKSQKVPLETRPTRKYTRGLCKILGLLPKYSY